MVNIAVDTCIAFIINGNFLLKQTGHAFYKYHTNISVQFNCNFAWTAPKLVVLPSFDSYDSHLFIDVKNVEFAHFVGILSLILVIMIWYINYCHKIMIKHPHSSGYLLGCNSASSSGNAANPVQL